LFRSDNHCKYKKKVVHALDILVIFAKQQCYQAKMDTPFQYDKYVTGKHFIGRREDCNSLGNLLSQGEHVAIYEPPKSGKRSLVQQALFNLRIRGHQFNVGQFSLFNIRQLPDLLTRLGTTVIRTVASTPEEYESIVRKHLEGTHFVFDQDLYSRTDEIISLSWDADMADAEAIFRLPWRLAGDNGKRLILIMDEFQGIMNLENGEDLLKMMEKVIGEEKKNPGASCQLIFSGSAVNAMKEIFEVRKFFWRQVEHFPMHPVDTKEITEYVVRGFLSGGKVIERDLLLGVCKMFRNNMWYINHLMSVADSLSKGYIVESTLVDALGCLLSVHEPKYMAMMDDLTTFQVSLLRAVLDGYTKFSASEVIRKYSLNSSANVKRLKDALMKKEILTFDDSDNPVVIDPLFEYWARQYYFEMKQ